MIESDGDITQTRLQERTVYNMIVEELMLRFGLPYPTVQKLLRIRRQVQENSKMIKKELQIPARLTDKNKEFYLYPELFKITRESLGIIIYDRIKSLSKKEFQDGLEKIDINVFENELEKYLPLLYKKIPNDGMPKAKLKNNTAVFKSDLKLFNDVIELGMKKNLFKIKRTPYRNGKVPYKKGYNIPTGYKEFIFIIKNPENLNYINNLHEAVRRERNQSKNNKMRYSSYLHTSKVIQELLIFMKTPRTEEEINYFVNNDLKWKRKEFKISGTRGKTNKTSEVRTYFSLICNRSLDSEIYLRRDIISEKADELGFYNHEGHIFHVAKDTRKRLEILAHVLKYGISKNLFEIFNNIISAYSSPAFASFLREYKNYKKNKIDVNVIEIKETGTGQKVILSKFQDVSSNQIRNRRNFWLARIEHNIKLLEFLKENIFNGGIKKSGIKSIPRRLRKPLLKISAFFREYRKNMSIKKQYFEDYPGISEKYACVHVRFTNTTYVFFDKEADYTLVEAELEDLRTRLIASVRAGQLNGEPSFLKLINTWRDKGINILHFDWTHGKKITSKGGIKFPIKKFGKEKDVEIDGYIIYEFRFFRILALVQHKDGHTYSISDCKDLIEVTSVDKEILGRFFRDIGKINIIESIFLVRVDKDYKEMVFKNVPNFRIITYNDIGYESIDENDADPLNITTLQDILNQRFKDSDVNLKEVGSKIDSFDDVNNIEFKFNGVCGAITINSEGKIIAGLKTNRKGKHVLIKEEHIPEKFIKQFRSFKNSSFKIELMFKGNRTWKLFYSMLRDKKIDLKILENKFFIVITDVFCLFNKKLFLSTASKRKRELYRVFVENDHNSEFLKTKERNDLIEQYIYPKKYIQHCVKNEFLCITPGLIFENTKSGLCLMEKFIREHYFLTEFPLAPWYLNIDGMMLKTDRYDLYSRMIYDSQAIKIKSNETFTLALRMVKKSASERGRDKGMLFAMLPNSEKYFPVSIVPIKNNIAKSKNWEFLKEPILLECAFKKSLFGNVISRTDKIRERKDGKVDEVTKILKHFNISKHVVEKYYKEMNTWNLSRNNGDDI